MCRESQGQEESQRVRVMLRQAGSPIGRIGPAERAFPSAEIRGEVEAFQGDPSLFFFFFLFQVQLSESDQRVLQELRSHLGGLFT